MSENDKQLGSFLLHEDERLDDLQINGLRLIQNKKNFCFGIDAVLLANFARAKKGETVLDLGTGTGIIPILLTAKTHGKRFIGLEIQEDNFRLARRNVELNGLQDRVEIHHGDIKNMAELYKPSGIDVITVNPPYVKAGSGLLNDYSLHKTISRHEVLCNLEDIVKGSARLLKPNGRMYIIHRPARLCELINLFTGFKIEPKTIQFIHPSFGKNANLVLIEAVRGGNSMAKILPPVFVYPESESGKDKEQ